MKELSSPYEDGPSIDRTFCPRMPWHDVGMCVVGQAAHDVARHFVGRWNSHMNERLRQGMRDVRHVYSRPEMLALYNIEAASEQPPPRFPSYLPGINQSNGGKGYTARVQVLRSGAEWSLRSGATWENFFSSEEESIERSVYLAYLELIHEAEHYIYIENQYFLSSPALLPPKAASKCTTTLRSAWPIKW